MSAVVQSAMEEAISAGNALDTESIAMLKEQHKCPYFRMLVIGRANAGKTTILEKICGVAKGTQPIIYDEHGAKLKAKIKPQPDKPEPGLQPKFKLPIKQLFNIKSAPSVTHLTPSMKRGIHDIEHQITYPGSNFIFHDSQGFESGASEEMEIVWKFIEKRSIAVEKKDHLHAIWYCIPMDSPRPLLSAELEFFNKGTGKVPLVVIFTKFDAQIIQESVKLNYWENFQDKWAKARRNADITFQSTYLARVLGTQHPPKAYVRLEGEESRHSIEDQDNFLTDMHEPDKNCLELTRETANALDDASLCELFVSTQMNNLDLCVKSALQHVLKPDVKLHWSIVIFRIFSKFPHYWKDRNEDPEEKLDWSRRSKYQYWEKEDQGPLSGDDLRDRGLGFIPDWQLFWFGRGDLFSNDEKIISELFSLFGEPHRVSKEFSEDLLCYQIIVAMNIIARQSFWIMKPFMESIMDALEQFKTHGYAEKLKTHITCDSIPPRHEDVVAFLYDQIINN